MSELAVLREQVRAIHKVLDDYEGEEALSKIREIIYGDDDAGKYEDDPDAK
jgi:hypothetical protein